MSNLKLLTTDRQSAVENESNSTVDSKFENATKFNSEHWLVGSVRNELQTAFRVGRLFNVFDWFQMRTVAFGLPRKYLHKRFLEIANQIRLATDEGTQLRHSALNLVSVINNSVSSFLGKERYFDLLESLWENCDLKSASSEEFAFFPIGFSEVEKRFPDIAIDHGDVIRLGIDVDRGIRHFNDIECRHEFLCLGQGSVSKQTAELHDTWHDRDTWHNVVSDRFQKLASREGLSLIGDDIQGVSV